MNRTELLREAERIVTKDRQATHGDAEDNFSTIAALWSTYMGKTITSVDVAAMMVLMKVARIKANPANAENWIDAVGYSACGGEIATRPSEPVFGAEPTKFRWKIRETDSCSWGKFTVWFPIEDKSTLLAIRARVALGTSIIEYGYAS